MKTGILGGTFNPPHFGHLRLAEEVVENFHLDKIIFVPCHQPPHKDKTNMPTSQDRLTMTTLACCDNPHFEVSDVELKFPAPSYTINTLKYFSSDLSNQIYFIMGSDSLKDIQSWKSHEDLFSLANFIIVDRPGIRFDQAWERIPSKLQRKFRLDTGRLIHTSGTVLISSGIKGLAISSTEIRRLLKLSLSARYLTPDIVLDYIHEHNLYTG
ncbi:MAG: nicotinate-nucleotide adenylyltransferase [Deltaproteobacteria bacterium]|nr:nicotinate-nucleotide adenylyltransferase [Deltaproteobacteria bacterium]